MQQTKEYKKKYDPIKRNPFKELLAVEVINPIKLD